MPPKFVGGVLAAGSAFFWSLALLQAYQTYVGIVETKPPPPSASARPSPPKPELQDVHVEISARTAAWAADPALYVRALPQAQRFRMYKGFPCPVYLPFVTRDEATPDWLLVESKRKNIQGLFPTSIFWAPDPAAAAAHNTGYIMVAVTTCCGTWNMTKSLLTALINMKDPIHVVLFDDNSKDGTPELASAMGFPVFTTGRMTGNTANMNRAWKYFTSYDGLQSLFIMNNDITVSNGAFSKLHRCSLSASEPGALGPVSDLAGLGAGMVHQNCDAGFTRRVFYQGQKAPLAIRKHLPEMLPEYMQWLDNATAHAEPWGRVYPVKEIFGFFMGFRKDQPLSDHRNNVLLRGGLNFGQEYFLFVWMNVQAYACSDVFAYHIKAATLVAAANGRAPISPH